jgi:hypothetical protein
VRRSFILAVVGGAAAAVLIVGVAAAGPAFASGELGHTALHSSPGTPTSSMTGISALWPRWSTGTSTASAIAAGTASGLTLFDVQRPDK